MNKSPSRSVVTSAVILATLPLACGKKSAPAELIQIPVGLNASAKALKNLNAFNFTESLNLAAGTQIADWTINVTGCKSGYTTTVESTASEPKANVALYNFDEGCMAGLIKFTFNGLEYTKDQGGALNGPAGDSAVFVNGSSKITIKVTTQLDSPLSASSKAAFNFFESAAGPDKPLDNYSAGHNLTLTGVEAPNFNIFDATLTAMPGGVPTFAFRFECLNIVAANACPTPGGDAQPMADMDVKIIDDTFGGTPTYADAESAFATPGTSTTADGSIGTRGGMTASVVGIGPMYSHRNLIVFIRYTLTSAGSSYRYFNVDIGEPVAP